MTLAARFAWLCILWVSIAVAGEARPVELPRLSGSHPIGTKTTVLTDTGRNRELLVTAWYPAAKPRKGHLAPYMDAKTAAAVAKEWELVASFAARIQTHAERESAVASGGPFPVVLLEHGSGTVPQMYTILAEYLASHGFVVIATNHPPDSLISVFPDGQELHFTPYWPEDKDRRTQGIAIGKFADEVLVRDVRFVLDQLAEMNAHDRFWRGKLDLSKVGIVGHSMGGTTAALATLEDKRILAGVNLDGSTYPGMNNDLRPVDVHKPFLFLATEEHAEGPDHAREYVGSPGNTCYAVVPGAEHMHFSDARWLQAHFAKTSKPTEHSLQTALSTSATIRSLVGEFFGKYLKGESAPHLDSGVSVVKK